MFLSWPGMNCHGSPLYYSVKKNSVTEQEENKNAQPYIDISQYYYNVINVLIVEVDHRNDNLNVYKSTFIPLGNGC